MKKTLLFCLFLAPGLIAPTLNYSFASGEIIADHRAAAEFDQIPAQWITQARTLYKIFYGHTSHGSQIVSGVAALAAVNSQFASPSFVEWGTDLGNPSFTDWAQVTRTQLNGTARDRNLVMWSWCGEASWATAANIQQDYLANMAQLEQDFPAVRFVYMTGHLDGTGTVGNLNQRNNQIRDFVRANGKVLFDFADIESYDPSGAEFLSRCAYDSNDYGCSGITGNWSNQWWAANPALHSPYPCALSSCSCAHTTSFNCDLKARAFWWMLARMAGWPGLNLGDVSENGSVTAYDASLAAQYGVGLITLTQAQITKADVSGNGSVTSYDASLIAQYAVGLITKFPVEG